MTKDTDKLYALKVRKQSSVQGQRFEILEVSSKAIQRYEKCANKKKQNNDAIL